MITLREIRETTEKALEKFKEDTAEKEKRLEEEKNIKDKKIAEEIISKLEDKIRFSAEERKNCSSICVDDDGDFFHSSGRPILEKMTVISKTIYDYFHPKGFEVLFYSLPDETATEYRGYKVVVGW